MADKIRINLTALNITLPVGTDFTVELTQGTFIATNPLDANAPVQLREYSGNFPSLFHLSSTALSSFTFVGDGVPVFNIVSPGVITSSFHLNGDDWVCNLTLRSAPLAAFTTILERLAQNMQHNVDPIVASATASSQQLDIARALGSTATSSAAVSLTFDPYANTVSYRFQVLEKTNLNQGFQGRTLFPFSASLPPSNCFPIYAEWGDGTSSTITNQAGLQAGHTFGNVEPTPPPGATINWDVYTTFTFTETPRILSGHTWDTTEHPTTAILLDDSSYEFVIRPYQMYALVANASTQVSLEPRFSFPEDNFLPHSVSSLSYAFNNPVGALNTLSNTTTNSMYPYRNWDTANVNDMSYCFKGTNNIKLNGVFPAFPDTWSIFGGWNTINVVDMEGMFENCTGSTIDIHNPTNNTGGTMPATGWNTSNVENMSRMFFNTNSTLDLGDSNQTWDVRKVQDASRMFQGANMSISFSPNFNFLVCTDCSHMFREAGGSLSSNFSGWTMKAIQNCSHMFREFDGSISSIEFYYSGNSWDGEDITDCSYMFYLFSGLTGSGGGVSKTRNIEYWNILDLTDCSYMWRVDDAAWNSTGTPNANKFDNAAMNEFIMEWENTVVSNSGPSNVVATNMFHSAYQPDSAAQDAIDNLNNTYNWSITW